MRKSATLLRCALLAVLGICLTEPGHAGPQDEETAAAARIRPDHFAEDVCRVVAEEATAHDIPAPFLARLIWKESLFSPDAVSSKGATGIAQFMPGTATERGLSDPRDAALSLAASAKYLAELKTRFGNLGLAAAAYNAGPHRVENWVAGSDGLPLETQRYIHWITGHSAADWLAGKTDLEILPIADSMPFDDACVKLAGRKLAAAVPDGLFQPASTGGDRPSRGARIKSRMPWVINLAPANRVSGKRLARAVQLGANTSSAANQICQNLKRSGWNCTVAQN